MKTLADIASRLNARLVGNGSTAIRDIASIEDAGEGDITFIADRKHLKRINETKASAVIISEGLSLDTDKNLLIVKDPYIALADAIGLLRPKEAVETGVHPLAHIHADARVSAFASVGAFAVIEEGAEIAEGAIIYPFVYIGKGARVGSGAILYSGVVVREGCVIGGSVIVHSNSVIGSDGFGYARDGAGYRKIPQAGIVRIEDNCEIGACVTIDRATLGETVIGAGTKIDNLVQIAHNVRIGQNCIIVAQTGIAGSARIGDSVQLGGQCGVAGHIEVGDNCAVAAKTGVTNTIKKGSIVSGMPAIPHRDWLRASAVFSELPEVKKRIMELEKRLVELEAKGE
ncbi:MAG: UDP-3-O-(3-hydroxymyristoyl)glucosamine N-acyltransferase [Deltaproteobacteria bacterium]